MYLFLHILNFNISVKLPIIGIFSEGDNKISRLYLSKFMNNQIQFYYMINKSNKKLDTLSIYQSYILIFFLILINSLEIRGQYESPYKTSYQLDIPLATIGTTSLVASHLWTKKKLGLTAEEIANIDADGIFKLDARVINNWSPKAAKVSDFAMFGSMALPLALLGGKSIRKNVGTVGLLVYETAVLNTAITDLAKNLFKRKRPFVYNDFASLEKKMEVDSRKSFFSGHTSISASMTFLTAKIFSDFYPNSKYKTVVWVSAAAIPAITGYLRVAAGKHFITDVITGYAVGALIGVLVPHFHKKNNNSIEVGQGVNDQNIPLMYVVLRF